SLQGCSEHAERDVPKARGRKKGKLFDQLRHLPRLDFAIHSRATYEGPAMENCMRRCDGHGKVETAVKDSGSVEKDELITSPGEHAATLGLLFLVSSVRERHEMLIVILRAVICYVMMFIAVGTRSPSLLELGSVAVTSLGCDIYLGEKSPFTVATYESSGSGNFTLQQQQQQPCEGWWRTARELQGKREGGVPSGEGTSSKVDMQYEDPKCSLPLLPPVLMVPQPPMPAGANVTAGIACKDLKKKAEGVETFEKFVEEASLNDETLTYRTVSIYVRGLRLKREVTLRAFADLGRSEREIRMRTTLMPPLTTIDIDKCKPTYYWLDYLRKPEFSLKCDVPGMRSKSYYPPVVNRPRDLSLTTQDIEWAQPKITRFRTNRVLDPLNPKYKLPKSEAVPVEPPRSSTGGSRTTSEISSFSHPKRLIPDRNYNRDPNDASDIEYARTKSVQEQLNDIRKRESTEGHSEHET
ncbi:hypothetical protein FOZ60_001549, partial [Perkinsus olseni]